SLTDPDRSRCLQAHRQSPSPRHLRKNAKSQGPLLHRHYPASTLIRPCPTPARHGHRLTATLRPLPSPMTCLPRFPEPPFSDVPCPLPRRINRVLVSIASPLMQPSPNGRRVGIRIVLSRPAQASLALRPIGSDIAATGPAYPPQRGAIGP